MNLTLRIPATILLLFVVACAAAPVLPAKTLTGEVVAIADGDTITLLQDETQYKIRLHGIDTPERGQDFGTAAKDFTGKLCFRQEVTVVVTDTDRYGREVGIVILEDGRILNHELVAAGLAHYYQEYAPEDEALARLQAEAQASKRGLWSRPDVISPQEFRQGKRNGEAKPYNPPNPGAGATKAGTNSPEAAEDVVYITDTGGKYHRATCRALRSSKIAVPRGKARDKYGPCAICKP